MISCPVTGTTAVWGTPRLEAWVTTAWVLSAQPALTVGVSRPFVVVSSVIADPDPVGVGVVPMVSVGPIGVLVRSWFSGSNVPTMVGVVPWSAPQAVVSITRIRARNRGYLENFFIILSPQ